MIRLGFYGAAGEVTGSCYLLTTDRARVVIDCGMHQGDRKLEERNLTLPPEIDPAHLSAVVLTHAHLDHCGRLPLLSMQGYRGRIHATPATCSLTGIILRDSAHLQEGDAERDNRHRKPTDKPAVPLYARNDVDKLLPLLTGLEYDTEKEIAPGISIRFFDAGHIIGSASVQMTVRDRADSPPKIIVFSGDIGVADSPILRDPVTPPKADVLILESTYGDRDHRPLDETIEQLLAIIKQSQGESGKVLIPAFAVGRTQDLIFVFGEYLRHKQIASLNVYVDSPMARETSDLYRQHKELFDGRATELIKSGGSPLSFPGFHCVDTIDESKRLNDQMGGIVVISASGMATGGRIVHHLLHGLPNPNVHVVIVGYQSVGTLGRKLVDGAKQVRIFGETVEVKARVHTLGGFSAHAGQSGLIAWARKLQASHPRLFLTHGEDRQRQILAAKLRSDLNMPSEQPQFRDVVQL